MDQYLPRSPTARFVIRVVLAVVCFAIAAVLTVFPGPAFVFWIAGFVLLGFGVGQILLSVHAVQEFLRKHVPIARRLPRMHKGHIRAVMRNEWVRWLDKMSGQPDERRRRRAERRIARARARNVPR